MLFCNDFLQNWLKILNNAFISSYLLYFWQSSHRLAERFSETNDKCVRWSGGGSRASRCGFKRRRGSVGRRVATLSDDDNHVSPTEWNVQKQANPDVSVLARQRSDVNQSWDHRGGSLFIHTDQEKKQSDLSHVGLKWIFIALHNISRTHSPEPYNY